MEEMTLKAFWKTLDTKGKDSFRMAVDAGFALTPSDAGKLIRPSVHDIDLSRAYFVLADLYSFRESPITTQRLFELATRGIAVMVGTRRLPPEFEPFCVAFYPE